MHVVPIDQYPNVKWRILLYLKGMFISIHTYYTTNLLISLIIDGS